MALPPSLPGALNVTVACVLPATALTPVGFPGTVDGLLGVALLEAADAALLPSAFVATAVKV